jgi:hypothetical protein
MAATPTFWTVAGLTFNEGSEDLGILIRNVKYEFVRLDLELSSSTSARIILTSSNLLIALLEPTMISR